MLTTDNIDEHIIQLLFANSRLTYREIAEKLNISTTAVYKRIQRIEDSGAITFTATLNVAVLNAFRVIVYGKTMLKKIYEACQEIGEDPRVFWVSIAGGNVLYIGGDLKEISDLQQFLEYIKKKGRISNLTVGIVNEEKRAPTLNNNLQISYSKENSKSLTLKTLDYQILRSLLYNSRKPLNKIAGEINVTSRTVGKHLTNMMKKGQIHLSLRFSSKIQSNNIIGSLQITLKPEIDRDKIISILKSENIPNMFFFWSFSNIPNFIISEIWTKTVKDFREIFMDLQNKEEVESVTANIILANYLFDTWKEKLIVEKGKKETRLLV